MFLNDRLSRLAFVAALSAIFVSNANIANGQYVVHQSTDSDNIHSNDTLVLELSREIYDSLRVTPGSRQQIELVFINKGNAGFFEFRGSSEDGLRGYVNPEKAYVNTNDEVRIKVFDLEVPNDPVFIGTKLKFKVNALARGLFNKRSAEEAPEEFYSDNDDYPRSVDGDVAGAGIREYGRDEPSPYDPSRRIPMAGGGGGGRSEGQSGGTFFPDDNARNPNNNRPDPYEPPHHHNDPSLRSEISRTLLFSVVNENDLDSVDSTTPYLAVSYVAQTEEETCRTGPEDPACDTEWWSAIFNTYDAKTGLNTVSVHLDDGRQILGGRRKDYFYRHENFPIGDDSEQRIIAGATCCHKSFTLTVTDVAGNKETLKAYSDQYGTPLSSSIIYIIIGVSVLVLVIVIVVLVWCGYRNRWCYKEVPQQAP